MPGTFTSAAGASVMPSAAFLAAKLAMRTARAFSSTSGPGPRRLGLSEAGTSALALGFGPRLPGTLASAAGASVMPSAAFLAAKLAMRTARAFSSTSGPGPRRLGLSEAGTSALALGFGPRLPGTFASVTSAGTSALALGFGPRLPGVFTSATSAGTSTFALGFGPRLPGTFVSATSAGSALNRPAFVALSALSTSSMTRRICAR